MKRKIKYLSLFLLFACSSNVKEFYPNGELKSNYPTVDGKFHGISKKYHPNGTLMQESNWSNGVKTGLSRTYHENGEINFEVIFENDRQNGWAFKYDSLGILESSTLYVNNSADSFNIYFPNGKRRVLGKYLKNKSNSISYHYYSDGQPDKYEVIREDTLFYQKWYNKDGSFGGTYLPISITNDSLFCISLMHSQFSEESVTVKVFFQKIDGKGIINSNDFIESDGYTACSLRDFSDDDPFVEGYLCEFYKDVNYGCMPFRYNLETKNVKHIIQ